MNHKSFKASKQHQQKTKSKQKAGIKTNFLYKKKTGLDKKKILPGPHPCSPTVVDCKHHLTFSTSVCHRPSKSQSLDRSNQV